MKKLALILFMTAVAFSCNAQPEQQGSLSPYFFVQSDDPGVDVFPLLRTETQVDIAGIIAEVKVRQVYKNEGKRTLEAVYVFPLGLKSAIHKMTMKVGERTIKAKIEERKAARQRYNEAKQAGKTTSLLEQERPNVFTMNVANIMPGDRVEVIVHYTELLVPEDGVYEFVYPTVVGPRYGGEVGNPTAHQWIKSPYLHQGENSPYDFDISVNVKTGISLRKVWVPSHSVKVSKEGTHAHVQLSSDEIKGANKDFILRYSLRGKTIQTGLLLYPGEKEKFFLLMAQPPQRITLDDVPSREYIFIVDVSGSMHGFPLNVSKALITRLLGGLRQKDYFNILFFSGGSNLLSPYPLEATAENKQRAIAMLQSQRGGGGTNLLLALQRVFALEKKEGLSRIIVAVTDGYVGVEKESFDIIRNNLNDGNFFAFGIGSSVNRYLIEGMARAGQGEPFIAINQKEANRQAAQFLTYIQAPLLTDINIQWEGFDAYDIEPISIPDLFAQKPLIIYGKYHNAQGIIQIRGKTAESDYVKKITVSNEQEAKINSALKYLWAREKIARLSDYVKIGVDVKDEVTELGLRYSLMTKYTSFVAVDTVVRETGEVVTIKQPLPLPEGVSDYAVADSAKMGCQLAAPSGGWGNTFTYTKELRRRESVFSPSSVKKRDEEDVSQTRPAAVYLRSAKTPAGITVSNVERQLKPLQKSLGKCFKEWQLKSIYLILTIENGKVKSLRVKGREGKEYEEEILKRILGKLTFPSSVSGKLELNLGL